MKILHTSDWHIGQQFNFHYDRQDEHQYFFEQLTKIIAEEKPDLLLVCGDIYDKSTPTVAATRFFNDALTDLVQNFPKMPIVIISGNHDSSSRLEANRKIWMLHNVHFVGPLLKNDDGYIVDKHIIKIENKCFVAAVPYIASAQNDFYNALLDEVERKNTDNLPVILAGHTAIGNCNVGDCHDVVPFNGVDMIGGIGCMNLADIQDKYDYFALGHIHTPQTFSNGKARYCGSPVRINFKENFQHSVSIVTLEKRGELPEIKEVEIEQLKKFYTIPSKPEPLETALSLLEANLPEEAGYVQLNILSEGFVPADTENRIRKILSKNENLLYCDYKIVNPDKKSRSESQIPDFALSEFREKDPLELALLHYKNVYQDDMDDAMKELLLSVIEEVRNENSK